MQESCLFQLLSSGLELGADGCNGGLVQHLHGKRENGGLFQIDVSCIDALQFGRGGEKAGLLSRAENGSVDPFTKKHLHLVMELLGTAVVVFEVSEIRLDILGLRCAKAWKEGFFFIGIMPTATLLKIVKSGGDSG